jgi:hypothetical protein
MLKKTLGISFVAASTMLAAVALSSGGCSSTTTTTETTDGATGDAKVKPATDGGDSGATTESCPGAAPTKADLDQSGGWKPPPAKQNVCSAADITAFEANFKGAANYSDLIKGLPAACGSCILGKEADATWNFVVTDDKGELGFFNYGACYARAAGGSDACGKAVQYSEFCINASCSDCASASESSACQSDTATQTACSTNFAADIQAGCGTDQAKLKALDDACGKATLAVGVLCGGGTVVDSGGGG